LVADQRVSEIVATIGAAVLTFALARMHFEGNAQ